MFVAAIMAASFSPAVSAATPQNVLMIPVDDLNDYILILQNHPGIKTPNFERLAERGGVWWITRLRKRIGLV